MRLSSRAAGLRRAVLDRYSLDPWEAELLAQALESLDRAEEARAAIGRELLVADARGGLKANPLLIVERDARASFARLIKQLGLVDVAAPLTIPTSFPRRKVAP